MTIHEKNINTAASVIIDKDHYTRLVQIANCVLDKNPYVAERLLEEIDRASICPNDDIPSNVVNMWSQVTYLDEILDKQETVCLVWPNEADIEKKQISIMTPIGAALIGLTEGSSLEWQTNNGQLKKLKILSVKN